MANEITIPIKITTTISEEELEDGYEIGELRVIDGDLTLNVLVNKDLSGVEF